MADDHTGYRHDASDKKLDSMVEAAADARQPAHSPSHDADAIRKHDDSGKDRLFEGRQQHDEAEKNSEKTRLARDEQRHNHDADIEVTDDGASSAAKRRS